ncbi:hypothetical protein GGD83_004553 [Rhodoblastus sphagnicola]|uniref:gas vesicle protein K n=1 Tax=Rhodoblastus sphagnicola TaxID=333368 RepID=UPI0017BC3D85|nr:gas vesicle protein K [Rhodoblastus sphagnicola]MBB4200724.1 hypothetical protein [Rhodoblastus sphagnicola]
MNTSTLAQPAGFSLGEGLCELVGASGGAASELKIDPKNVERDLSRLVLSLIEFLRQVMEAQAIRRMESGTLTAEEEEALGLTLMRAGERIVELAAQFGLKPSDLKLDLGPLGRLV